MPIFIAAAATAATASYTIPLLCSGAASIAGFVGGYFWMYGKETPSAILVETERLIQLEKSERQEKQDNAIINLVQSTEHQLNEATSNTKQVRSSIESNTKELAETILSIANVDQRLCDASKLIEELTNEIKQKGVVLSDGLNSQLAEFIKAHKEQITAISELKNTVAGLQDIAEQHEHVQKKLQEDTELNQKIIQALNNDLSEALLLIAKYENHTDDEEKEKIRTDNQLLIEKNTRLNRIVSEYINKLNIAGVVLTNKEAELCELRMFIKQKNDNNDVVIESKPSSLTMFGNK